ncbi:MAG: NAD-dependent epimerase/dehydratase family protein [Ignavibacteria bacterium]|nr:NAD-dependent epimerase/dehydratase family protein [Ignavibacteria bacterium]
MKILVTGGAGFIGSHVADAYVEAGHSVVIVDDLSSGSRDNVHPNAHFYQLDIRHPELEDIFRREAFDIVNHHAAQMDVRTSVSDPSFDASVNILGGLNVFENARKYGAKRIVFASTGGAIYGEQDTFPADEQHPLRPLSPYGITKLCTEKYLYYYKEVHGIEHVILRYANVFGPRQNPHGEAGVVAIFASRMLNNQEPIINGDGKQTRDYTFVSDVVRANLMALEYPSSDIFNVGTGVETDVNVLFSELRRHLKPDCPERHGPAKQGEQRRSVISCEKIKREMGWSPHVDVIRGLALTASFFREQHGGSS